ncbi:CPBP family intramembrane glutamic endopeptidase [Pasteurella bettyae]|uniref:CAAX amino terminal protease self-immunity n=1 Tax=Pasteurella bettyae CCUG 2042 TaxID=1095749 RepID=I3DBF4_9PAST|nr:CPBP family intramembrane glutamic endopeptidase [Pasteurella bettyae]EIJ69047.1 CAAX amino terminal protease self- immunity [Pasteurella bettyae CCUG 2042]SUB22858.1 putative transmembrane protein [Pasteurella bettyae]
MKKTTLNLIDILLLTLIFFGSSIYASLEQYLSLQQAGLESPTDLNLNSEDNYSLLVFELFSLCIAFAYLWWRHFDFKQLNFSINKLTLPLALLFILLAGGIDHLFYMLIFPTENNVDVSSYAELQPYLSFSLIAAAILNGFYEELYFLGLMFTVPKKWLPYVIIFGLVIRFLFHTYQGLFAATTVTLFGLIFVLLRLRFSTLLPFMLAHAFFDVFGLGLPF